MKIRFEINQAEDFRRGIDRPKSIVSIEVNPADLPEESRGLIANHLDGIDVLKFFYHHGEVIKGYPIKEGAYTSRDPARIIASAANVEALVQAIKANDDFINRILKSFDHFIQCRLIDKPPVNEREFQVVSDQRPDQIQQVAELVQRRQRVCFECFIHDVQTSLNKVLNANSYVVYLLPTPPSTAQAKFYCEPVFAAKHNGQQVVAHTPIIVLNEKTGRKLEVNNLFQALDAYILPGLRGTSLDDLSILSWEGVEWRICDPESLIDLANDADKTAVSKLAAE